MNTRYEELEDKLLDEPKKALKELNILIENNDADAMYVLGMAYYDGDGVNMDRQRCLTLLTKASSLGHIKATHDLGCFYYYGYGFPEDFRNLRKSAELLERSANKKYAPSMTFLGSMYKNGEGVEKNLERAKMLFKEACGLGDELGKKYLSEMENT